MFTRQFLRWDGPTLLVALVLYGAWGLLIWYNAVLPWWFMMPVGAYLLAWHFSLQHEAIHSFRGVPAWLRFAVVFPQSVYGFRFPSIERATPLTIAMSILPFPESIPSRTTCCVPIGCAWAEFSGRC